MAPLTGVLSDRFLWVWVLVQVHVSECVYERERERVLCSTQGKLENIREGRSVGVCERERDTQRDVLYSGKKFRKKNRPFSRHYKVMQCRIFTTLCVFVRTCKQTRIHAGICCAHTDLWL